MSDPSPAASRVRSHVATLMLACAGLLLTTTAVFSTMTLGRPIMVTYGTQVGAAVWSLALATFPAMGWLILRRDDGNRVGWLFLWIGVAAGLHLSAVTYSGLALLPGTGLPWGIQAAWVGNWGWIAWIGAIGVLLAPIFPDGRPPSPRWWPVIGLGMIGLVAGMIGSALAPGALEVDPRFANPFGVSGPVVEALEAGLVVMPAGVLAGAVAVVVRYRRANALGRVQLRWFLASVVLVAVGFAVVIAAPLFVSSDEGLMLRLFQDAVNLLWASVAISVGVAVLRYRLFSIDVIINRALVYATLTVLLAGAYIAMVIVLQMILVGRTGESDVAVAGSTLVVALLFGPLRRRVQSFIDRRFYRARYDTRRLVEGFVAHLRGRIDLDEITGELEDVIDQALRPATMTLWMSRRPRADPEDAPRR